MGKFINKVLGTYSDIDKAVINPDKIKRLRLDYVNYDLNEYKKEIQKFKNLKELSITFPINYNYSLPNEIGQLKSLKKFHILNYNFIEFPNWLFDLNKLDNLMLRGNNIETIPSLISELLHLKHLRIENTGLNAIPDNLKDLKKLKTLSLVDNFKLKTIDHQALPKSLKWISLTHTGIPKKTIDEITVENPSLKLGKRFFG